MLVSALKPTLENIELELAKQTDRGAAIIGCAIVEDFLTDALKKRLILTNTVSDQLFNHEKNGPLAHFAAKINIGFATGIVKPEMRDDLHFVRRVRNRFAHRPIALDFSDAEIAKWCDSLRTGKKETRDRRDRYIHICSGMSAVFASISLTEIEILPLHKDEAFIRKQDQVFSKILDQWVEVFDMKHRASPRKS